MPLVEEAFAHLGQLSGLQLAGITIGGYTLYLILRAIYRLTSHPLARIPGPPLAAVSDFYGDYYKLLGGEPQHILKLHRKYGSVVRIAPNTISFNTATSWKDIYGHSAVRKPFLKSKAYFNEVHSSIVTERDPKIHGRMRKMLAHAFSAKALGEQEDLVELYVDRLIAQIGRHCTKPEGEEMVKWYNFCTFDIIGDLAFGEPFGSLDNGQPHFWVSIILDTVKAGMLIGIIRRYPNLSKVTKYFVPAKLREARKNNFQFAHDKAMKRMNTSRTRKDFMTRVLVEKEAANLTVAELTTQSSTLVIAGSETTATFLSGVTYHLLRTPRTLKTLQDEIRSTFSEYTQINAHSVEGLPYLNAVINEGLRIYPPVPIGMPRESPGEWVDGTWVPEGVECSTSHWAATHDERNFSRPFEFVPERWIDPDNTDDKAASQPFLLGSRVCLGRNLALMEMRLILAKIVYTYDMECMNDNLDWDRDNKAFTLWLKPKLMVKYTPRKEAVGVPAFDGGYFKE